MNSEFPASHSQIKLDFAQGYMGIHVVLSQRQGSGLDLLKKSSFA